MQSSWTEFFYGACPSLSPTLSSSNWVEWEGSLLRVLQPYQSVIDVLQGKAQFGAPPDVNATIDVELFHLLVKGLRGDAFMIALDARTRYGCSGSKVYRILKAHFDMGLTRGQATVLQNSPSTIDVANHDVQEAQQVDLEQGDELYEDDDPDDEDFVIRSDEESGDSTENEMMDSSSSNIQAPVQAIDENELRNLLAPLRHTQICPTNDWHHWSCQLVGALWCCPGAREVLDGTIKDGDSRYSSQVDAVLFDVLEARCKQEETTYIVRASLVKHGRKGSKLFAALKDWAHWNKKRVFEEKLKAVEGVTFAEFCDDISYDRAELREQGVRLTQEEIVRFTAIVLRRILGATSFEVTRYFDDYSS